MLVVLGLGSPTKFSPSLLGAGVGGHAARTATAHGISVRAVARNPEKYAGCFPEGVQVVKGDVNDEAGMREVLKGAKAVIFAVQAADDATARSVDCDGLVRVAKVCVELNVKLVVISSMLVSPKNRFHPIRGVLNWFVKSSMMDAKFEGEEACRKMPGLRYVVVRPSGLTDGEDKHKYQFNQGDSPFFGYYSISRKDVGALAVAAAFDDESDRVTCEVMGGKASTPEQKDLKGVFAKMIKDPVPLAAATSSS